MEKSAKILRLGTAGLRGIIGNGLDLSSVADFSCAFAMLLKEKNLPILVARDNRKSSQMLHNLVVSSLLSMGIQVINGGILPAGCCHFIIKKFNYAGGILISGGHQEANWNSIIPLNSNGEYFNSNERRELYDSYHSKNFDYASIDELKKIQFINQSEIDEYFKFLQSHFDCPKIKNAKLRVIFDCCNGSGSFFLDRISEIFGIELIKVNAELESDLLPRNPEPSEKTGKFIAAVIKELKGDIGIVFNSDVSRLSIVTEKGEALSEEKTFPLALDYILEKDDSCDYVCTNICSSAAIDKIAEKHQRKIEKTAVGEANIIEKIHLLNSFAGGEGSGSFVYGGDIPGFDAFFMLGFFLESMALSGEKISERAKKLPELFMKKMVIKSEKLHRYSKLRGFKSIFQKCHVSELDGIRFDFEDGFLSIRFSGTDKLIRLISESRDKKLAEERIWFAKSRLEL
jgi:phosphomannomutase